MSAFGISGTNAHVILKEALRRYVATTANAIANTPNTTATNTGIATNTPNTIAASTPNTIATSTAASTTNIVTTDVLVPLSARTPRPSPPSAGALADHLAGAHPPSLPYLAYVTGARRVHFAQRLAVSASDHTTLIDTLARFARGQQPPGGRDGGGAHDVRR